MLATALLLLAPATSLPAATIRYVGTLTNAPETRSWLTPSVPKTYDFDGDGKYGSFGGIHWLGYTNYSASTVGYTTNSGTQDMQGSYALIDSLADACQGNVGVGALVNNTPFTQNSSIISLASWIVGHTFQVNSNLVGKTLRVGITTDIGAGQQSIESGPGLYLVQTAGGNARSVVVPVPFGDSVPDMTFFDITDAQTGDQYTVLSLRTLGLFSNRSAFMGEVSFDVAANADVPAVPPVVATSVGGGTIRTNGGYHFAVLAGSATPFGYQWYKGGTPLAGATNATYDVSRATPADAGDYSVVVENSAGLVTTPAATLTVAAEGVPGSVTGFRAAAFSKPGLHAYYSFDNLGADSKGTNHASFAGTPGAGASIGSGVGSGSGADNGTGSQNGLFVNGADGFARAASDPHLDFDNANKEGTVCAWIRCQWNWTSSYPAMWILSKGSTAGRRWAFGVGARKSGVRVNNGTATDYNVSVPGMAVTSWYFASAVFSNGTATIYLNGTRIGANTNYALGTNLGGPLIIGALDDVGTNVWSGGIDEVAIYTNALSDAAILSLYSAFLVGDPPRITRQPDAGNHFLAGTPYTISLTAAGNQLTYRWYRDGELVSGVNTNFLSFPSLALANAGTYVCVVSNLNGEATSSPCVVTVGATNPPAVDKYEFAVRSTPSLISFYTFNDLTPNDSVGTNHGTLPPVGTQPDALKYRAGFGGGPDQALVPNLLFIGGAGIDELGVVPAFAFSDTTGTVELWLKAEWTFPTFDPCIFSARQDGGAGTRYSVSMSGDKTRILFNNGSATNAIDIPSSLNDTTWHHLAVVFSSNTWSVIWDGALAGTNALPLGTGLAAPVRLGSSSATSTADLWQGRLDEVAFYANALTVDQVYFHYNPPPVPRLTISPLFDGFDVLIDWPAELSALGWELQASDSLSPANWVTVAVSPPNFFPVALANKRFYRLWRP